MQKTDSPGKKNSIGLFLWYEYTIVGDLKLLKFQQLAQKIPGNLTVGSPNPLLATSSPPFFFSKLVETLTSVILSLRLSEKMTEKCFECVCLLALKFEIDI